MYKPAVRTTVTISEPSGHSMYHVV